MELKVGPEWYKFEDGENEFVYTGRYVMDQKLKDGNFHTFYQRLKDNSSVKEEGCKRIKIPIETSRIVKVDGLTRFIKTDGLQSWIVWPTPPEEGRKPLVEEWLQKVLELDEDYPIRSLNFSNQQL